MSEKMKKRRKKVPPIFTKKCAAKKREKSRPNYNPETVMYNNLKRDGLLPRETDYDETDYDETYNNSGWADDDQWGDCDLGIHD